MRRVSINNQSLPAVGMGTWHLGRSPMAERSEIAALKTGLDAGLRVIDTAEMYGRGRSEELVGKVIAGRREDAYLTSKVFPWKANRFFIEKACHGSLRRLGTDYLDLYLLHWRGIVPLGEAIWSLERLRTEGKIRHWGVSNFDIRDMDDVLHLPVGSQCVVDQIYYSPQARGAEYTLFDWFRENGVTAMGYSPLGGKKHSLLNHPVINEIARDRNVSPATILIAWSIRGGNVLTIPQTSSWQHMYENIAALEFTLRDYELKKIDAAFPSPTKKIKLQTL